MDQKLILDLIVLGPVAGGVLLFVLRFFRNSVLYKLGLSVGILVLFLLNITILGNSLSENPYFVLVPLATVSLVLFFRYLRKKIMSPLIAITNAFQYLQNGDFNNINKLDIQSNDELGKISDSANRIIDGFTEMTEFASQIGKGNLDIEYETLGENDALGSSLLEMQKSLKVAREEEEIRKANDEKHFWTNEGFAKFGEILRENSDDNKEFYYSILSNLVKYVNANQGGLFLINDDDENNKFIELVAMYAYDRRKYANRRIEMGESLVGQCILEGESIYMTDIPQHYVTITSGLGDANPNSLLLVPLRFNEKVYGVLELASFEEFEDYKKKFIEKLGESIASTISTYKINLRTVKLLRDSKTQSEELAAQEEEIRQNMEELQTTQEESARRESEMANTISAIHDIALLCEMDLSGKVISINEKYCNYLGSSSASINGSSWVNHIIEDEGDNFAELLHTVKGGEPVERIVKLSNGKQLSESYSLVLDAEGFPFKIVNLGLPA